MYAFQLTTAPAANSRLVFASGRTAIVETVRVGQGQRNRRGVPSYTPRPSVASGRGCQGTQGVSGAV